MKYIFCILAPFTAPPCHPPSPYFTIYTRYYSNASSVNSLHRYLCAIPNDILKLICMIHPANANQIKTIRSALSVCRNPNQSDGIRNLAYIHVYTITHSYSLWIRNAGEGMGWDGPGWALCVTTSIHIPIIHN